MASKNYDSFRELKKGKYDWKVRARVMNLWRGYTLSGEPFKWFNLLLVDNKKCRIHVYVPADIADEMESQLVVGNIYLFKNFTVKDYRKEDKFRPIEKDIQIVFSSDTKVVPLDESDVLIEQAVFDFYDLSDLKQLSKQTTYLTDFIGVIKTPQPTLRKVNSRRGGQQSQIKFDITDGRTEVKVTFWDAFAELFAELLEGDFEYPLIVIIGSGRVTEWEGIPGIANVAATTVYLNSHHYSVTHMRKMLKGPEFVDFQLSSNKRNPLPILTIEQIKQLGETYIKSEVMCQVTIEQVPEDDTWFKCYCTSCYNPAQVVDNQCICHICKRIVQHPEKWFQLRIIARDKTGIMGIVLDNQPAKKCFGKSVREIQKEHEQNFPTILKSIEQGEFTMKLLISKENILKQDMLYLAKDIMQGQYSESVNERSVETQPKPIQESYGEPSGGSYHLDSMSVNN